MMILLWRCILAAQHMNPEKKLENLQLYHEMVLSPLCNRHMEYHQRQERLLELGTDTPNLTMHRQLGS